MERDTPAPSPSVLAQIGRCLVDAAGRILSRCGGKLDKAADEAAEELGKAVGKWALPLGTGPWASQAEAVQAGGRAILSHVRNLPCGPFSRGLRSPCHTR